LTYIPFFCAIVTLSDIMDAFSMASEKKHFEPFCTTHAVQVVDVLSKALPLTAFLASLRLCAVWPVNEAEV